jgi:hypothetical protein
VKIAEITSLRFRRRTVTLKVTRGCGGVIWVESGRVSDRSGWERA